MFFLLHFFILPRIYTCLTVQILYMCYRWYLLTLRVKHFYTNRERCEVLTYIYHWSDGLAVTGRLHDMDKTYYRWSNSSPTYCYIFLLIAFLAGAFIRKVIIMCINFTIWLKFFFLWLCSPARAMVSWFTKFRDHTQRRATVGRTPLDEWSARRRDLYLTTHTADKHPCSRWD
jgi:hypothetical protein